MLLYGIIYLIGHTKFNIKAPELIFSVDEDRVIENSAGSLRCYSLPINIIQIIEVILWTKLIG
jgi:hypothetical protein